MSEALPEGFAPMRHRGGDFIDANGPVYMKREAEVAILGLRLEMRHCSPGRMAHGGMLVAMVDDLMGYTVYEILGRKPAATASLTCDFLGPARLGDWVEARCQVTRAARDVIFLRGEASANGQLVLTASALFKLPRQA
ncbi:MAG: PaaI family thioesterase [Alphaproteobacteria bacterium]|nr:PaaI family thioesterase [Alphaproteobacteria bacterium]